MSSPFADTASPLANARYSVGTLTYTRRDLRKVFFWLLWGDFCLTLMDNGVVSVVLNQQLKDAGASKAAIGLINGTTMALMSALFVSVISTASDKHRGRLGRRMPFLLWSAPPLAFTLLLLGFSPSLARWLHDSWPRVAIVFARLAATVLPDTAGLPQLSLVTLATMTSLLVVYKLFDLIPQSIYYPLWADVIPPKLMGTFACMFRIVAYLGMFLFNRYILGWASTHPEWLYVGAGLLYLFSFVAMSLIVKEGEYPPPPPREVHTGTFLDGVWQYLRESFSIGYYLKFYLMNAAFIIAVKSLNQFIQFFGTETLGLSLDRYGKLISWKDLLVIIPFTILGPIVDKVHPLRTGLASYFVVIAAGTASFFFIRGEMSFAVCVTALYLAIATFQASTGAIGPRLLPREQYGQFNSAGAMVFNFGWAGAAWMCGSFLDHMNDYRYLFLWFTGFCTLGFVLMLMVYSDWKRLGGDDAYVAPLPRESQKPSAVQ